MPFATFLDMAFARIGHELECRAAQSHAHAVRGYNPRDARWQESEWMVHEQKLTVKEAVEAYTMGSAYAEFQENEKGSITPGKWPTWCAE